MHRVLAVLIALLLAGGASALIVKSDDDTTPIVQPTASPTQTFTFDGAAPTESEFTEPATPLEPGAQEPTVEPTETETMDELPRTGNGSFAPAALLTLAIALGAGLAVARASRSRA
jgi:hypothetical protein